MEYSKEVQFDLLRYLLDLRYALDSSSIKVQHKWYISLKTTAWADLRLPVQKNLDDFWIW